MIKVLVVNTIEFSRINGITAVIMNYYRNMNKNNLQMDFLVLNQIEEEYREEFQKNHARVYCLERKQRPIYYCIQLEKLLRRNQYDVIHIHGNSAMMLPDTLMAKFAGVPVRIVHSHNTTCSHMRLHQLFYPIFQRIYTHAFACGQDAGKWLFRTRPFVEIKNGIDLKKYSYNQAVRIQYRKKLNANGQVVIGHVGNFFKQKNHEFLINLFAELLQKNSNYLLVLISDGDLMDQIKKQVERLGLKEKVIFLGKISNVHEYLQAMDMFVLPSLFEGLPLALVEAQAAGLPCLVADTISREVNLTNSMQYLSIQDTTTWVKAIQETTQRIEEDDRIENSKKWGEDIRAAGYDIRVNANRMRELYFEYYEEMKRKTK